MIITVAGQPGSGKSTLAKNLAKALGLKHHSTGEIWREIAKERGTTPLKLNKVAESDESIDLELDKRTEKLGKREDNFVMDSRMAWHFIPKSVKIFVKTDLGVVAERIFKDRRKDEKENTSLEKTLENLKSRMESERQRYLKLYGVDYLDGKNYNLVIDNSDASIEETLEKALAFVKSRNR